MSFSQGTAKLSIVMTAFSMKDCIAHFVTYCRSSTPTLLERKTAQSKTHSQVDFRPKLDCATQHYYNVSMSILAESLMVMKIDCIYYTLCHILQISDSDPECNLLQKKNLKKKRVSIQHLPSSAFMTCFTMCNNVGMDNFIVR